MSSPVVRALEEDATPRPDRMHRVLVTRAEEDAAGLIASLQALGVDAPHVPLIVRELARESTASLRRALVTAEVVLLTSATAARAVGRVWREPVRRPRIACVGPATVAAAESAGLTADVVPDSATGRDLVAALGPLRGVRVLYPRPEVVASGTTRALDQAGADLTEIVAYRNIAPPDIRVRMEQAGTVDLVTLFSGSSARRFLRACNQTGQTPPPAVVIGPSTAATATRLGLHVAAIASPHTERGVVESVRQVLGL